MGKIEILRLVAGFRKFHEKYYAGDHPLYQRLATGGNQTPKTLIIGCSDSRVDPALIASASPGEIFVVRNVANLVPPYELGGGFHGVSAAIEFAVVNLKVENIIVLGHRQCGGIRALMLDQLTAENSFVQQWVQIAQSAKNRVLKNFPTADQDTLCRNGELESIVSSLSNLRTFPFVKAAIKERGLSVLGIYFDLESGELLEFSDETQVFNKLEI